MQTQFDREGRDDGKVSFVAGEKGRTMAVQIYLETHSHALGDFWDGLISESRRKEKARHSKTKANLVKRGRLRD